ncbi:MAG TPA: glycosyltransferase family 4 protein [Candidatus Acidoferrales bacterium]|nr:glycosyltransferase family 4 protein [Candidatus Acidoferrales bacterium]
MRNWAVLRALAAEGHEITLLTFADHEDDGPPRAELSNLCRRILRVPHAFKSLSSSRGYFGRALQLVSSLPYGVASARSEEMNRRIAALLREESVDAILCEETDLLLNLPRTGVPLIVDFHNVDHLILERYIEYERNLAKKAYAFRESHRVRRWEAFACGRAAAAMACSEHDRMILQRHRADLPIVAVPNAIHTADYQPGGAEDARKILFQGGMDWFPNRDGVEFFAAEIFPLIRAEVPDARFVAAGRNPSNEFMRRICRTPGIEFTGTVPDMRAEIANAAVSVIPLRIGSGTRLKILEAAAMGKAMVSTKLGAEGLDFAEGEEIRIADDPKGFASAVIEFLRSPADRKRFGAAARARVERQYSLPAVQSAMARVLASVTGQAAANGGSAKPLCV